MVLSILSVAVGAVAGWLLPREMVLAVDFVGAAFMLALRAISIPLIVTACIIGVADMASVAKSWRTGGKTLVYFLGSTAAAVIIGLALTLIIQPGAGVSALAAPVSGAPQPSFWYISLVLLSLFFGGALVGLGRQTKTTLTLFLHLHDAVLRLVQIVMYAAPVGVMILVATTVAANRDTVAEYLSPMLSFVVVLAVGLLLHAVVVLPLMLKFLGQRSALTYLGPLMPALSTGMATASSALSLPLTYEGVQSGNNVEQRAGAFVLPLGGALNMNGTALFAAAAAVFVCQVAGVSLSILQILGIALGSLVISITTVGYPSAALVGLIGIFQLAGLPPAAQAGVAMILALDWFFDRLRTPVNIWSDAVGAAVIAQTFEFKTARATRRAEPVRRTGGRYAPRGRSEQRPRTGDAPGRGRRTSERPVRESRDGQRRQNRNRTKRPSGERVPGDSSTSRSGRPARPPRTEQKRATSSTDEQRVASPFELTETQTPSVLLELPAAAESEREKTTASAGSRQAPGSKQRDYPERNSALRAGAAHRSASTSRIPANRSAASPRRENRPPQTPTPPAESSEVADKAKPVESVEPGIKQNESTVAPISRTPVEIAEQPDPATSASDSPAEKSKPVPSSPKADDSPSTNETSKSEFGRRQHRKGARPSDTKTPPLAEPASRNSTDDANPEPEFSTDSMSFGRSKKKRSR